MRPAATADSISSRYGSQAFAVGARPTATGIAAIPSSSSAGGGPKSEITSLAGFGGRRVRGARIATPAALR